MALPDGIDPVLVGIFGARAIERLLAEGAVFDTPSGSAYACRDGVCVAERLLRLDKGSTGKAFPSSDDVLEVVEGEDAPGRDFAWWDAAQFRLAKLMADNDGGRMRTPEGVLGALLTKREDGGNPYGG